MLKEKCSSLKKDNNNLRGHIASMSGAKQPIHDEQYYIGCFEELRNLIEGWCVQQSKVNEGDVWTERMKLIVLDVLEFEGEKILETLAPKVNEFAERRMKITVIRHLIAVAVFHGVLCPYIFGLSREKIYYFRLLEEYLQFQGNSRQTVIILSSGLEFEEVLTTRQAFNKAILRAEKDAAFAERKILYIHLNVMLCTLLPRSHEENVREFVIKLRNHFEERHV